MVKQADKRLGVHHEAVVDLQEELEAEVAEEVNLVERLDGEVDEEQAEDRGRYCLEVFSERCAP